MPGVNQALGFDAPVHGLITGKPNEFDRRIEVVKRARASASSTRNSNSSLRVFDDGHEPRRRPQSDRAR